MKIYPLGKICRCCEKFLSLDNFSKNPNGADSYRNQCKTCRSSIEKARRQSKIDEIRAYDRSRPRRSDSSSYRLRYPKKYAAHIKVGNAVRDGVLIKQPCEICGIIDTHAHHDNYNFPLDVRWLCPVHHCEWHMINGEGVY